MFLKRNYFKGLGKTKEFRMVYRCFRKAGTNDAVEKTRNTPSSASSEECKFQMHDGVRKGVFTFG